MEKNPNILVIGAGASGLAAATKLYENGFRNITILEAENRIGGRIHSAEFGGSIVDLGAQWVHGENGNLVYEMVKDLDLLSPSYNDYRDMTFYLPDGSVMDKQITDILYEIGEKFLFEGEDEEKDFVEAGTCGTYFSRKYNEEVVKIFGRNKENWTTVRQIEEWFHKVFHCLNATKSWHDISPKGLADYQVCEGDHQLNWRNKGFQTILDVLMKKIPDPSKEIPIKQRVLLNKAVNAIIWDDDSSNQVTIKCTDGSSFTADHILVTVSIGVLKENHKKWFKPMLPPYKVNSIEHLHLGIVNKIFLKFPKKWWSDDVKGFSLIWTDEARLDLMKEVANIEPTFNGKSWMEDLFGFYVIDSDPNILAGWVVGEMAAEVEKLSDEVVLSSCMYLLRKFAGKRYNVSEPEAISRTKWGTNPHFLGSWSYHSLEAQQYNARNEDLARPVSSRKRKDVLLFAGESTHSTYYSTVHGALETGFREADRLISLYKPPQNVRSKL